MSCSPALLCCTFLVMLASGGSRPLAVDTVKNNIKMLAQTAVVRIQRLTEEFRISPNVVFSGLEVIPEVALDRPNQGLTTVVETLNTFQSILLNLQMDGMSQIHADLVSLQGTIRSLALLFNCSIQNPRTDGQLYGFLKANSAFQVTIGNVALSRLQQFLRKLIANLEQLKTC